MDSLSPLIYALLGGFLPPLIWLWFWLREDSANPEPKGMLILAFMAGIIAVPLVIIPEKWALDVFRENLGLTILSWAIIEEVMKYLVAFLLILRSRYVDEPIDGMVYMITVALGFAALENTFFLVEPFKEGNILLGILTGNLRFIGATLLHTVASAAVGAAIGLSFYKHSKIKHHYIFTGLCLAVILHALFNLFIIRSNGEQLFFVFGGVWLAVVLLIFMFEKIKHIIKPKKIFK
jgi:RsiW-degrading membrane proteinase PrsW (M82 family)